MAIDYSAVLPGSLAVVTKRAAMSGTAGNAVAVTLPDWCKRVSLFFTDSSGAAEAGKFSGTGTDGAAIGNDVMPVPSGAILQERIQGGHPIYLAGSTNSGYCHIAMSAYEVDGVG